MQRTYQFSEVAPTRADGAIFEILADAGRRQRFANGSQVLHRGDPPTGFWVIERGQIIACRFGREGERILYGVLGRGDLIGELACLTDLPQQVNAIAEGEVELIWVDMRLIDRLLAEEPRFARWLLNALASKMRSALDRIEGGHSLSAQARIARVLADVSTDQGLEVDVTQQELADFVGVSRVTVGQVLGKFAQEGLIERHYGRIKVVDLNGISAYAS